jgi:choline dehydrogenase-like flavoprotein
MKRLEGDFDYIVVGAGTSGCILANRLSQDTGKRVLILEAGGHDNWIWFHIPVGYLFAIGNPRSDWMFRTEAEPGLNGRSLAYPRGKVIGGCSAINAMISMRGQAADYDHWRQLGLRRCLAAVQEAGGSFSRRQRASWDRRRLAHRGAATVLGGARCRGRSSRGNGDQEDPGLQHRRQ